MGYRIYETDKDGRLTVYPSLREPKGRRSLDFLGRIVERMRALLSAVLRSL